jgi:vacuolar-type H+-ATPase subunit H
MMDKFVHLLNAKKRKIYHLQNSISRKRHRAIEEQEKVKAEANAKAKEEQEEIQPSKKLKTGEKTEEIINHPDQDNEESDWELSDSDINPPQTVR